MQLEIAQFISRHVCSGYRCSVTRARCSVRTQLNPSFLGEIIIFSLEMSLAAVIVNPYLTIGDYKRENIVSFFPVLEEELIRNICFKIFETYILSCQFRNIYVFKKVKIFR